MGLIRSAGVWLGLVEDDRYREDEDYLDEGFAVPPARGTSRPGKCDSHAPRVARWGHTSVRGTAVRPFGQRVSG